MNMYSNIVDSGLSKMTWHLPISLSGNKNKYLHIKEVVSNQYHSQSSYLQMSQDECGDILMLKCSTWKCNIHVEHI